MNLIRFLGELIPGRRKRKENELRDLSAIRCKDCSGLLQRSDRRAVQTKDGFETYWRCPLCRKRWVLVARWEIQSPTVTSTAMVFRLEEE